MRAQHAGYCKPCATRIEPGEEIAVLVGQWVHQACKATEIARRSAAAGTVVLELVMPDNESVTYVGTKHYRRKGRNRPMVLTRR